MEKNKIKKVLLIIGFLAIVFLMGFFIWKIFFKQQAIFPTKPEEEGKTVIDGLPLSPEGKPITGEEGEVKPIDTSDNIPTSPQEAQQGLGTGDADQIAVGGLTKTTTVVKSKTIEPTLGKDGGSVQFYNKDDGKFYMVNENGDLIPLSDKVFHNVSGVEWAPNKTKAVIEYPDQTKIIYDFASSKQVTLPKHWEDFTFSPDSEKLVNKSLGIDPDNRWLVISNSDGTQTKMLENLGENDKWVIPSWSPNNQSVGMYTEGVDANRREVFFIGEYGQNFKSTIVEGWGFQPQWSQDGDKLLYSVYSPKDDLKPKLWIVDASGDNIGSNRRSLELETWAEKCTFASDSEVYCAVPKNLENMSGMFPELALKTSDDLYKINTQTGQKTLIAVPDQAYNISSIIVDKNQENIFFTDQTTGQIHKVDLK